MSKKNKGRTIAGFDSVAGDDDNNIKINRDSDIDNDLISNVMKSNKPKTKTHEFKGYYFEKEIVNVINKLTEGKPKGTKSDLVNDIVKKYFKDHDLL